MPRFDALAPLLAIAAAACASGASAPPTATTMVIPRADGGGLPDPPAPVAAPPMTDLARDARTAFDRAEDALARGDFTEAERGFADVRRRFAFSRLATDAQLRIADIAFRRQHYEDAARLYGEWMHDHRSDARLDQVRDQYNDAMHRAESGGSAP